jgi:hypothetical protein
MWALLLAAACVTLCLTQVTAAKALFAVKYQDKINHAYNVIDPRSGRHGWENFAPLSRHHY